MRLATTESGARRRSCRSCSVPRRSVPRRWRVGGVPRRWRAASVACRVGAASLGAASLCSVLLCSEPHQPRSEFSPGTFTSSTFASAARSPSVTAQPARSTLTPRATNWSTASSDSDPPRNTDEDEPFESRREVSRQQAWTDGELRSSASEPDRHDEVRTIPRARLLAESSPRHRVQRELGQHRKRPSLELLERQVLSCPREGLEVLAPTGPKRFHRDRVDRQLAQPWNRQEPPERNRRGEGVLIGRRPHGHRPERLGCTRGHHRALLGDVEERIVDDDLLHHLRAPLSEQPLERRHRWRMKRLEVTSAPDRARTGEVLEAEAGRELDEERPFPLG